MHQRPQKPLFSRILSSRALTEPPSSQQYPNENHICIAPYEAHKPLNSHSLQGQDTSPLKQTRSKPPSHKPKRFREVEVSKHAARPPKIQKIASRTPTRSSATQPAIQSRLGGDHSYPVRPTSYTKRASNPPPPRLRINESKTSQAANPSATQHLVPIMTTSTAANSSKPKNPKALPSGRTTPGPPYPVNRKQALSNPNIIPVGRRTPMASPQVSPFSTDRVRRRLFVHSSQARRETRHLPQNPTSITQRTPLGAMKTVFQNTSEPSEASSIFSRGQPRTLLRRFASIAPNENDEHRIKEDENYLDLFPGNTNSESQLESSPPFSPPTPITTDPETMTQFKDRNGVVHNVSVVILTDDEDENVGHTGDLLKSRLRKCRSKPAELNYMDDILNDDDEPVMPLIGEQDIYDVPFGEAEPKLEVSDYEKSHEEDFEVLMIMGEKIGYNDEGNKIHMFCVKWVGYTRRNWILAEKCHCPLAITEFRELQRTVLLAAQRDGREDLVNALQKLCDADMAQVDTFKLPKIPGWRSSRRNAKSGRFQAPGLGNSVFEFVRLSTAPPQGGPENTAPLPEDTHPATVLDTDSDTLIDEVIWMRTDIVEGPQISPLSPNEVKSEQDDPRLSNDGGGDSADPNSELERAEIIRKQPQDAKEMQWHQFREGESEISPPCAEAQTIRQEIDAERKELADLEYALELSRLQEAARQAELRWRDRRNEEELDTPQVAAENNSKGKAETSVERELEGKQAQLQQAEKLRNDRLKEHGRKMEAAVRRGEDPEITKDIILRAKRDKAAKTPQIQPPPVPQRVANPKDSVIRPPTSFAKITKPRDERSASTVRRSLNEEKFNVAIAAEKRRRAVEKPSLVRSEFKKTMGEKQARDLVAKSRIPPPRFGAYDYTLLRHTISAGLEP